MHYPSDLTKQRIILIDDDASFGKIIVNFAEARGVHLDYFQSLQEIGFLGHLANYSVAIVDYDLGSMNGIEIAEYLPALFGGMSMVLISGKDRTADVKNPWPHSVRQFVHKDSGPNEILDAALKLLHSHAKMLPTVGQRSRKIA